MSKPPGAPAGGFAPSLGRQLDSIPAFQYHFRMLLGNIASATIAEAATKPPLVEHPAGQLAVLLGVLAVIFWTTQHPTLGRLYKVVPALVFCYFLPAGLTSLGVIPDESVLYSWVKTFVLPASLLLLILALDVPGIIRLGPKAVIMLLAGTAGVVVGGPIALLLTKADLPADAWQGMSALSGSWIGGGANMVALQQTVGLKELGPIVIVDVLVANIWMGALLYMSSFQHRIDSWTGANAEAIRDLERRMTDFQERTSRIATLPDLMMIVALGFVASWLSYKAGIRIFDSLGGDGAEGINKVINASTWKFIIVTAVGVVLSFTAARNLEGAGASRIGTVMIYLLVACIGAQGDFRKVWECPAYIVMGLVWMAFHITFLLVVGKLIRAPIFFVAVGSQANIGGAASAPVVASAFHPSLAPVGALLAVAGYVLGTYAGLVCMFLLKMVAGVD